MRTRRKMDSWHVNEIASLQAVNEKLLPVANRVGTDLT
jgi:hypothetical protein